MASRGVGRVRERGGVGAKRVKKAEGKRRGASCVRENLLYWQARFVAPGWTENKEIEQRGRAAGGTLRDERAFCDYNNE